MGTPSTTHPRPAPDQPPAAWSPITLVISWFAVSILSQTAGRFSGSVLAGLVHFIGLGLVGYLAWRAHRADRSLYNPTTRPVPRPASASAAKVASRSATDPTGHTYHPWTGGHRPWHLVGLSLGIGVCTWLALTLIVQPGASAFFSLFSPQDLNSQASIRTNLVAGGWVSVIQMVMTLGVVPLGEELFFRGGLYSALRDRASVPTALTIQALAFGLVHVNPVIIVVTTCLGLINGYVLVRTRAFVLPVMIHIVFNLLSVFVVLVQGG